MRCVLLIVLLFSLGSAAERTYVYRNRTIRYSATVFDPPLAVPRDAAQMNQETAVNCAALFQARLQAADIEGAASLSTDPARIIESYAKYRERVGETVYREQLAKLASEDLHYRYELIIGNVHALVADDSRGLAHYLRLRNGKFYVEYPDIGKLPKEIDDLSVLVNAIADGKLKLEGGH